MDERERRVTEENGLAERPRLGAETLLGYLGIGCILLALPLFWVAFDIPVTWVSRLIPLVAFSFGAAGVALTLRVPGSMTPRSRDPRRPLTRAGVPPTIERPATSATRLSFVVALGLTLCAGAGYFAGVIAPRAPAPWALVGAIAAGVGLWAQALLIVSRKVAAPALRWQRLTVGGGPRRGGALAAIGTVAIGAALLLALMDGFWWGELGLAALLLALVVVSPLARRTPEWLWTDPRQPGGQGARE